MLTIIVQQISWAVGEALLTVFCCYTLERRFSWRKLVLGTIAYHIFVCLLKIPAMFARGMEGMEILNAIYLISYLGFNVLMFRAKASRRILALTLYAIYNLIGEFAAGRLAYLITGELDILQLDSAYMITGMVLMTLFLLLFFYPVIWMWERMKETEWLGILFPLSQWILLDAYLMQSNRAGVAVAGVAGLGIVIGILGDCYMFMLIYQSRQRQKAERELRELRYLREKDRLHFAMLEEKQKEVARIRHDYQNYLLVLQRIARENESFYVEKGKIL